MEDKNRQKAIELAVASIEKEYGKGSIMRLKDGALNSDVQVSSSGSIGLDIALGIGGYPRGRIIEIYGPESSGKTTLTLHAIASAQRAGGVAAFALAGGVVPLGVVVATLTGAPGAVGLRLLRQVLARRAIDRALNEALRQARQPGLSQPVLRRVK